MRSFTSTVLRNAGVVSCQRFTLLGAAIVKAQPAGNVAEIHHTPSNVKTFVLIFRQNPARALSDSEKQQLAAKMRPWAQRQNAEGRKLAPHILAPESEQRGTEINAVIPPPAWPVTALLFLEARDLGEATQIAESHPGLLHGAVVEVRAWAPPVPPVPVPSTPNAP
jgi:hypothetical protein